MWLRAILLFVLIYLFQVVLSQPENINQITLVSYQKKCFDECVSFLTKLYPSSLRAVRDSENEGVKEAQFSQTSLDNLFQLFLTNNFFSLEDQYSNPDLDVSDSSESVTISVMWGQNGITFTKEVTGLIGAGPLSLLNIQSTFEDIIDSFRWQSPPHIESSINEMSITQIQCFTLDCSIENPDLVIRKTILLNSGSAIQEEYDDAGYPLTRKSGVYSRSLFISLASEFISKNLYFLPSQFGEPRINATTNILAIYWDSIYKGQDEKILVDWDRSSPVKYLKFVEDVEATSQVVEWEETGSWLQFWVAVLLLAVAIAFVFGFIVINNGYNCVGTKHNPKVEDHQPMLVFKSDYD